MFKPVLLFLLLGSLFLGNAFSQISNKQIDSYTQKIDSLFIIGSLTKVSYPNMSGCSGSLNGFYNNGKLVYIRSFYGAEAGYTSKIVYIKNSSPIKYVYQEYLAEWDKHLKEFPKESAYGDYKNMTYTDTSFIFYNNRSRFMFKKSKNFKSKEVLDSKKYKILQNCYQQMISELYSIRISYFFFLYGN